MLGAAVGIADYYFIVSGFDILILNYLKLMSGLFKYLAYKILHLELGYVRTVEMLSYDFEILDILIAYLYVGEVTLRLVLVQDTAFNALFFYVVVAEIADCIGICTVSDSDNAYFLANGADEIRRLSGSVVFIHIISGKLAFLTVGIAYKYLICVLTVGNIVGNVLRCRAGNLAQSAEKHRSVFAYILGCLGRSDYGIERVAVGILVCNLFLGKDIC